MCHFAYRVNYEVRLQSTTFTVLGDLAFNCAALRKTMQITACISTKSCIFGLLCQEGFSTLLYSLLKTHDCTLCFIGIHERILYSDSVDACSLQYYLQHYLCSV